MFCRFASSLLLLALAASLLWTPVAAAGQDSTPEPEPLYMADSTGGLEDWTGSPDWIHRDGHLINDGTTPPSAVLAPYELPKGISDYAIEVEARLVRCDPTFGGGVLYGGGFGIVARAEEAGAYWAGPGCHVTTMGIWAATVDEFDVLASTDQPPSANADWHRYRVEVQRETIRLFVDGNLTLETSDLRYSGPGQVGLWSSSAQIDVRSFAVLPLDFPPGSGTPAAGPAE